MSETMTILTALAVMLVLVAAPASVTELYEMRDDVQSRWSSFENPKGLKGQGGMANKGAKGAAFAPVRSGETVVLMEAGGPGMVHRMWFTLRNRDQRSLRSYVLRMYWDGEEAPAVEVPFGDFFGHILGRMSTFESEFFASPEGRSLNCFIPMPFRSGAKITFTNDSEETLEQLFYDVNYSLNEAPESDLYFHAIWRRERWTELERDFEILPKIEGKGRFLGTNLGIIGHPGNIGWWGEGEVKVFLDGDGAWPTLVGTGTEDYVGTAYGQGEYAHRFQGSLFVDNDKRQWGFYRYHVPDPIYFHEDIRVTIQQMGGASKGTVAKLQQKGVEIAPISVNSDNAFVGLRETEPATPLSDPSLPDGWTNMYRRDDVSAIALFYLDRPANGLPRIAPVEARVEGIVAGKK